MCFRYKNAKLYRKRGILHGFRYTKVRPCIEIEAFFEVFDTVELVMQGRKLTCAFEGLKDARKLHKLRFAYFINLMILYTMQISLPDNYSAEIIRIAILIA